jgi:hypothetical protein
MPPRSAHQRAARQDQKARGFGKMARPPPHPLRGKACSLERLREQARCKDRPQPRD